MGEDKAIVLGHPSYVWRRGQDHRLNLVRQYVPLEGRRILDIGCGLGMYVEKFRRFSAEVYGVDIDEEKVAKAGERLPSISYAPAEDLPFKDRSFDVTFLHEVIEHVADDRRAIAEALRCTDVGGHVVIFAPNRLYPMETHGFYFRGRYHFRLLPLVNYLPGRLRDSFCPHVRVYTAGGIRKLFEPNAPSIEERVRALDELHQAGIKTFVMIAPMLPGAEELAEVLAGKADSVIVDRMNYHYADWVYRKHGLQDKMTDEFFVRTAQILTSALM